MKISWNEPDGLHIVSEATLTQLLEDETLSAFAGGLLQTALAHTINFEPGATGPLELQSSTFNASLTLAEALHYSDSPQTYPLLTALLALDAEIHALVDEERRILSLPGFLSYRASLPPDKVPLETLRLPPLNMGGHYVFAVSDDGTFLAIRLDLNPALKVAGHVRIAVSRVTHPPIRLVATEQRLEHRVLDEKAIETAIAAGNAGGPIRLTQMEQAELVEVLKGFIQ